jgi:hypothetical protein
VDGWTWEVWFRVVGALLDVGDYLYRVGFSDVTPVATHQKLQALTKISVQAMSGSILWVKLCTTRHFSDSKVVFNDSSCSLL